MSALDSPGLKSNFSRNIEKKRLEDKKVEKLGKRLQHVLLLKNNIKGTETKEFRRNKDINPHWGSVIEDICIRREKREKD